MGITRTLRLLARLRPRHLPYVPLALTLALSEGAFARPLPRRWRRAPEGALDWRRGVSVIVPERGAPAMLAECLAHLAAAIARLDEPAETIVVVNGTPLGDYAALAATHPAVRWLHSAEPLGFVSAVRRGVAAARHGAIYLLNNDMLLEPGALAAVLAWRGARVFAVASQIFFQDPARRREETGWTAVDIVDALPAARHDVPASDLVRGTVWAGAGCALFHTGLLRTLLPSSAAFDPFYWEDVDLSVRAWRGGSEVLFCPASVAWHRHRATVERFYDAAEVARVFERNRLLFQLRNPLPPQDLLATLRHVSRLDRRTLAEVGSWRRCAALWRARGRAACAPYRELGYATMSAKVYPRPLRAVRPALVLVSPYVVLPPRHGGALRTQRLAALLAREFDVILLSDEADLYGPASESWYSQFASVHLVRGRPEEAGPAAGDRIARIRIHSHPALRDELTRIVDVHRPLAVLVEHVELAALVDAAPWPRPPFILTLQDVLLCPDDPAQARADRFELALIDRFDGRIVTSPEDQALLGARESKLVGNGVDVAAASRYVPSSGRLEVLFMGPFRSPPNWEGIRAFCSRVYPEVEAAVPGVTLRILGGGGARRRAAGEACFARPSIAIVEEVADVGDALARCALTINPQAELRGSSLKVLESLAAGRVCVSTRAGARGRRQGGFRSLVVVERIEDFAAPLVRLLRDEEERLALEAPEPEKLAPCSWEAAGRELCDYVRGVIARRAS